MNIEQTMDPELQAAFAHFPPLEQPGNLAASRAQLKAKIATLAARLPKSEQVTATDCMIPGSPGAPEVPIRIYQPIERTGLLPGILFLHGGGFSIGDLDMSDPACRYLVERVISAVVVSVDYRLAPEHPFPAALEDCYAAFTWLAAHVEALGVDPSRLAVRGPSSGGTLAAAVALLARDRQGARLAFQQLLASPLDDQLQTPSSETITDPRVLNREALLTIWKDYLGSDAQDEVAPYAAPARMNNLSGLPPTYIMVGELDPVRDENIEYARRLMQAGVPTELHVYSGSFHGFESQVPTAAISQRATAEANEALKRALQR